MMFWFVCGSIFIWQIVWQMCFAVQQLTNADSLASRNKLEMSTLDGSQFNIALIKDPRIEFISFCTQLPLWWSINQNKLEFTYYIDLHIQLVGLLLILLVACARLRWRWKIQFAFSWRRRLLQRSLWKWDASMLSRRRVLCWVSSRFRLTTFVARRRRLFALL